MIENDKKLVESLDKIITDDQQKEQAALTKNATTESLLSEQDLQDIDKEVELEKKYGNQNLRTLVESAASAASFGIFDQVVSKVGGPEAQEALRERRQRNTAAAVGGEILGVVAPTVASGGSSLLAKGASAGVRAAASAGSAVEKITAKQLANILSKTGNKKIAQSVINKSIAKGAGSAVEAGFYGAGQLVSEDALGTADFNAENLIAAAGAGAIVGGIAGGAFGAAEALIPVIKNNKVVDIVSKKVNNLTDASLAAAKISNLSAKEMTNLNSTVWGKQIYKNLPDYYSKNLKMTIRDSDQVLYNKTIEQIAKSGDEIGKIVENINTIGAAQNVLPTRSQIAAKIQENLSAFKNKSSDIPDLAIKNNIKKINKRIKSWDDWLDDNTIVSAIDIRKMKSELQEAAKFGRSSNTTALDNELTKNISRSIRDELFNVADKVSVIDDTLAKRLRKENLDYATGLVVSEGLEKKIGKEASAETIKFKDLLLTDVISSLTGNFGLATVGFLTKKFLESDIRRKVTILTNVEKANLKINSSIKNSVSNFFSNVKKSAVPISTKILSKNLFVPVGESGKPEKAPKDKYEAFEKVSKNIEELAQDPEKRIEYFSKLFSGTSDVIPNTSLASQTTLSKAISFLDSKIPRNVSSDVGLFAKKWKPSSIELAKFERYLTAIENPMSVLEDLESNTITRESIEAIKFVYPNIYSRIQNEAMEFLKDKPEMPYSKRVQMGILLDIPSDISLAPENIAALQQTFYDLKQQQTAAIKPEGAVPTTQGGVSKINKAEHQATETQKLENK